MANFRQTFMDADSFSDSDSLLGCCTVLFRFLFCIGPRPGRTRSTGVETTEYNAPAPSGGSSSSRRAEAQDAAARDTHREDTPLLKGGDSAAPGHNAAEGTSSREHADVQGMQKKPHKEGFEEWDCNDEDFCPTCLDPYTDENPAIETKCRHRFHLACIYEWLERSRTCPVCDRGMEFEELEEALG